MVPKEKIQPACRYFRLRCIASLVFAAGLLFCSSHAFRNGTSAVGSPEARAPQTPAVSAPELFSDGLIVIDPGHGGMDPGTIANGQYEKSWTLSVGVALAKELRARGWTVELTRTDDGMVPLPDRSAMANRARSLVFISIHFNAGRPDASGIETYYAWPKNPEVMARLDAFHRSQGNLSVQDERGRLLAEALQGSVCAATGARNRGVRNEPGYSVISRTHCPAVLVECGFLTNPVECREIQDALYREKIVRGLADGVEGWVREAAIPGYGITTVRTAPALPLSIQHEEKKP